MDQVRVQLKENFRAVKGRRAFTERRYTYGLFSEVLGGLVEVLGGHDPNVGMVAQNEQALLGGEHDSARDEGGVLASEWILFLEVDEFPPQLDLERRF